MSELKLGNFAKNSSLTMLRQILALFIGIVSSIVLVRVLGAEGKGIYSVALLLPTIVLKFTSAGIDTATIYYIGNGSYDTKRIIASNFILGWLLGGVSLLVSALVVIFFGEIIVPGTTTPIIFLAVIALPLTLSQSYLISALLGLQKISLYNITLILQQVSLFIFVIIFVVLLRWHVQGALIANLVMWILVFLVTLRFVIREVGMFTLKIDRDYLKG